MTVTVNSNDILAILPVVLPVVVAFIVGLLHQDEQGPYRKVGAFALKINQS